jgi:cyanophycin synthetase
LQKEHGSPRPSRRGGHDKKQMKTDTIRALRGPNLWSDETLLEVVLAVDSDLPTPAMLGSLRSWLPNELAMATQAIWDRSDASESHHGEASLVAELTAALERIAGAEIAQPVIHELQAGVKYRIIVQYQEEEVGRRALTLALDMLAAARADSRIDLDAAVKGLRSYNQSIRLGPSTGAIVHAAEARGIPTRRLTDGSLVMLGYGSRQRRIWAAETDRTSAIGESIAQDKELTKSLLSAIGVPVPEGRPVESAEEAWAAAQEIGVPVVVKPRKGNQGRGVSVRLTTREAIMAAFEIAVSHDGEVLVERQVEGCDFRLLVIGGRLIAAARRDCPTVVGNGQHTITQLVEIANQDPLRGEDHATALSKLRLDAIGREMLADQGLTVDTIPSAGQVVVLRRNANLSTGGSAVDVTDEVHPLVAERAIDAAAMIGLDVAGIDVITTRIDQPLHITHGAIVEVNAAPGLRMHIQPSHGTPRPVGEAMINSIFPHGENGRIPIVAVTGTNGKTTTTRCVAHLLQRTGRRVGLTCTDGIYVENRRIDTGDCSGPKSARALLGNPRVDAAVLETARGGVLREGLGFDWCDVAIVTNVGEGDHLGLGGIATIEDLARVKSIPVRRVSAQGAAVLNADDPLVVEMAKLCRGSVIFFSRNPESPVLVSHRSKGGKAVTVRDGAIVLATGRDERRIARLADLPLTHGGRIAFQVENLLASIAAGHALGISIDAIRTGIETFSSDIKTVPGRFNVVSHKGSTIILDYGHNSSALLALNEAIEKMPHRRRKIVYTAAGDRRDEDIVRQAQIIADFFHEIYIYEDKCTRGRPDGEVMHIMREGFSKGRGDPLVLQERGEMATIGAAIASLKPGDLLLCQVDQIEEALDHVTGLLRQPEVHVPISYPVKHKPQPAELPATVG